MDRQTTRIKLDTDYPRRPSPYLLHWMPITHTSAGGKEHTIWKDESQLPIDIDPSTLEEYFDEVIAKASDAFGGQENYQAYQVDNLEELERGTYYIERLETESSDNAEE